MPRTAKVEIKKKLELVRKCLENKISIEAAGQEAGVNMTTVSIWIRLYETEGVSGLLPSAKNRKYSTETKISAVLDYLGKKGSLREICKKYKIRSTKQLGEWIKVYNAHGDFNSVKHSGGGSYMKQGRDTTKERTFLTNLPIFRERSALRNVLSLERSASPQWESLLTTGWLYVLYMFTVSAKNSFGHLFSCQMAKGKCITCS